MVAVAFVDFKKALTVYVILFSKRSWKENLALEAPFGLVKEQPKGQVASDSCKWRSFRNTSSVIRHTARVSLGPYAFPNVYERLANVCTTRIDGVYVC